MPKVVKTTQNEQISAWVDGELSMPEMSHINEALIQDERILAKMAQYRLISEVLSQHGMPTDKDLLQNIAASVDKEAAINLPESEQVSLHPNKQNKTVTPARSNPVLRQHPSVYALVASIFLAVVLVYNPFVEPVGQTNQTIAERTTKGASSNENQLSRPSYNELQAMLVAHGQFSNTGALNGLATYSKLVGQDAKAEYY